MLWAEVDWTAVFNNIFTHLVTAVVTLLGAWGSWVLIRRKDRDAQAIIIRQMRQDDNADFQQLNNHLHDELIRQSAFIKEQQYESERKDERIHLWRNRYIDLYAFAEVQNDLTRRVCHWALNNGYKDELLVALLPAKFDAQVTPEQEDYIRRTARQSVALLTKAPPEAADVNDNTAH